MRLLDSVAQADKSLGIVAPDGAIFRMPSAETIAGAVRAAPLRYVLDDAVAAFAASLAFEETPRLLELLDLVRLPAPSIWIEWDDAARANALQRAGFAAAVGEHRRAGVLITGAADGRAGFLQTVWSNEAGEPDMAPLTVEFSLDSGAFNAPEQEDVVLSVSTPGHYALGRLFAHARFRLQDDWRAYYAHLRMNPAAKQECLAANLECVAADFPFAIGLLLTLSAKNALAFEQTPLARLNRARAKCGKRPLLEHTHVSACLERGEDGWRAASVAHREVRQHFVCGHLVRRDGQIFWRRSHLRGNPGRGVVLGRRIHLRMARAARVAI